MEKQAYEAPAIIELGDFSEETGFIGWLYAETIDGWRFSWPS